MRYFSMGSGQKFKQYKLPRKKFSFNFFKRKKIDSFSNKFLTNNPDNTFLNAPVGHKNNCRKKKFILAIFFILILAWLGLLIYLPYFQIKKITYYGLNIIQKEDIDLYLKENFLNGKKIIIPNSNYFLLSADKIKEGIKNKYTPEKIEVKKVFPDQLYVDVEEKNSSLIYDNGANYFLLDGEGTVIKFLGISSYLDPNFSNTTTTSNTPKITHQPDFRETREKYGNYPVLFDERSKKIQEKQTNILSEKVIEAILLWQVYMEKEGIGVVKYYSLEDPLSGIKAHHQGNLLVHFQAEHDLQEQVNNLKIILRDFNPKEYIDLRYGDRLYWR